jgi:secreted Zn-dependent insulinase-like peptidase
LDVVLINDESLKSSVSLTVGGGSFADPEEAPGIAHLTEHVMMLGNSKSLRPMEFEDLLATNYGSSNSFTDSEKTTFYYELNFEGMEQSLKMFSRMLTDPMINAEMVKSQLDIIQKEIERKVGDDQWRENQVLKSLANSAHPYSKFSLGDLQKLRKLDYNYLANLVKIFYSKFYTPQNMKLVVSSHMNIEPLEKLVSLYFSDIRSETSNSPPPKQVINDVKAFTFKELGQIVWYQKLSSAYPTLDFIFNLDEVQTRQKIYTKPLDFLSYLIKFSGEGSLLNYLKNQNLAHKLEVGIVNSFKSFSQYGVSIYLTKQGLENTEKIIETTFSYLNSLRADSGKDFLSYYSEMQEIYKNNFFFNKKVPNTYEDLQIISTNLFDYDSSEFLIGENMHNLFNATMIKDYINSLLPENSLVVLGSKDLPSQLIKYFNLDKEGKVNMQKEKYFEIPYTNNLFTKEVLQKLEKVSVNKLILKPTNSNNSTTVNEFTLRPLNSFVSKNLKLNSCWGSGSAQQIKKFLESNKYNETVNKICAIENDEIAPRLVQNVNRLKIWHKLDRSFHYPRVDVKLNIISPLIRGNSNRSQLAAFHIYFEYLSLMIEKNLYSALDAGNEIKLEISENGIIISISAYNDLISKIMSYLVTLIYEKPQTMSSEFYSVVLHQTEKHLVDKYYKNKYEEIFKSIIKKDLVPLLDIIQNTKDLTLEKIMTFIPLIQNSFYLNILFYGDIPITELNLIKGFFKPYIILQNKPEQNLEEFKLIDYLHSHSFLDGSFVHIKNVTNFKSNTVTNYYQIGTRNSKSSLIMDLIQLIWGNIFKYNLQVLNKVGKVTVSEKQMFDNVMVSYSHTNLLF